MAPTPTKAQQGFWTARNLLKICAGLAVYQCITLALLPSRASQFTPGWTLLAMIGENLVIAVLMWVAATSRPLPLWLAVTVMTALVVRTATGIGALFAGETRPDPATITFNAAGAVALFTVAYLILRAVRRESIQQHKARQELFYS